MNFSKAIFYFLLLFIFGIFLGFLTNKIFQPIGLIFLIFAFILFSVSWQNKKILFFAFALLFIFLGIWRYQLAEWRINKERVKMKNLLNKEIILEGRIKAEPDIRKNSVQLVVQPEVINNQPIKGNGNVLIISKNNRNYNYGEELKVKGKIKEPEIFNNFDYKGYLERRGVYWIMFYPRTIWVKRGENDSFISVFYSRILELKGFLRTIIYRNIPAPKSFILGAMLLGDKGRITKEVKEKLNVVGLRHLTAVSGMHIVILSSILMSLLISLGLWRNQAFYLTVVFIFIFILMTGFQPSGIRAGIMGFVFLLAEKVGRKYVPSRSLALAAFLMLVLNPLLLFDVSFQLSFLAVIGIIYLTPILENKVNRVKKNILEKLSQIKKKREIKIPFSRFWRSLEKIILMTLAAQIFTLPILIYDFNRISLVALLTNFLVIPIIYWLMFFGFLFVFLSLFSPFLGWLFSFPCLFLLEYFFLIVNFFAKDWAAKEISGIHWFWLFVFYFFLIFIIWRERKRDVFLRFENNF